MNFINIKYAICVKSNRKLCGNDLLFTFNQTNMSTINNKKDNQGFKNLPAKTESESFNDLASNLTKEFIKFLKDNGLTLPEPKININEPANYSDDYGEKDYKFELTSEIQDPIRVTYPIDEISIGGLKKQKESSVENILDMYLKGYFMSKNSENEYGYPDNSIMHDLAKSIAADQAHVAISLFSLKRNYPNKYVDTLTFIYPNANKLDITTQFNRILEGTDGLTDLSNIDSLVYRGIDTEALSNSLLGFMIIMYNEDKDKIAKEVLKPPYEIIKDVQSYYKDYLRQ